jgi:hypothetical protein
VRLILRDAEPHEDPLQEDGHLNKLRQVKHPLTSIVTHTHQLLARALSRLACVGVSSEYSAGDEADLCVLNALVLASLMWAASVWGLVTFEPSVRVTRAAFEVKPACSRSSESLDGIVRWVGAQVKDVLEQGGQFSGINRKAQLKPLRWETVDRETALSLRATAFPSEPLLRTVSESLSADASDGELNPAGVASPLSNHSRSVVSDSEGGVRLPPS